VAHTSRSIHGQQRDYPAYEFPLSELAKFNAGIDVAAVWVISSRRSVLFARQTIDLSVSIMEERRYGTFDRAAAFEGDRIAIIPRYSDRDLQATEADIRANHMCPLNPAVRPNELAGWSWQAYKARAVIDMPLLAANDRTTDREQQWPISLTRP